MTEWIHGMRAKHILISWKMMGIKTKELYDVMNPCSDENFLASSGWLHRFMKRNDFSLRRRTTVAQKDARHFTEKLVNFVYNTDY